MAWFSVIAENGLIDWQRNPNYAESELIVKTPETYTQLGLETGKAVYIQFEEHPERFNFVPFPHLVKEVWENFIP